MREICQLRKILECEATRCACLRIAPFELNTLEDGGAFAEGRCVDTHECVAAGRGVAGLHRERGLQRCGAVAGVQRALVPERDHQLADAAPVERRRERLGGRNVVGAGQHARLHAVGDEQIHRAEEVVGEVGRGGGPPSSNTFWT